MVVQRSRSDGSDRRSTRLVQFTDTHLLADPHATLRGARTLPHLQACLAHARRNFFPADAVLVTGDIVHDDPAAYGLLELALGSLEVPVLLIPGNHDVPDELERRLGARSPFQVGGQLLTANGWQVLLLSSWFADSVNGEGRLGRAQLQSLDRLLEQGGPGTVDRAFPHVFVFVHHPPVPMDSPALDALALLDGDALCRTVARHPRVRGVAWGHAHQSLDLYGGEVRFMCTPATSMQFKPRSATFETDHDRPPGYRLIDLHADGSISTEVAWLEGYIDVDRDQRKMAATAP